MYNNSNLLFLVNLLKGLLKSIEKTCVNSLQNTIVHCNTAINFKPSNATLLQAYVHSPPIIFFSYFLNTKKQENTIEIKEINSFK
jgi:hypothetical protein